MAGIHYAIIIAVIGMIQVIAATILTGLFSRETKRRKADSEAHEKRAAVRANEIRLSMELTAAAASLSICHAYAYKEGHVNGKMDTALPRAEKARDKYYALINSVASERIAAE